MKEAIKAWLQANATNEVKATEIEELFKSEQRKILINLLHKLEKGGGSRFKSKEWIVDNYLSEKQ